MNKYTNVKTGRDYSLDVLRGLILVIMLVDHIGGPFRKFTFESLGFVSAAEGFVYLSGLVFGLVYGKKLLQGQGKEIVKKASKRSAVIYFYHLLLPLVLIIPVLLYPELLERVKDARIITDYNLALPFKTILFYLGFLFRPSQFGILPMYCIYILIAPFVLKLFQKGKAGLVLAISVLIWWVAWFDWFHLLKLEPERIGMDLGYFNVFSWQILFFLGSYIGYSRAKGKDIVPKSKIVWLLAIFVMITMFVVRYSPQMQGWFVDLIRYHTERGDLGILRILNFFVLAFLIDYLITHGWFFRSKWLEMLGQHSLQVFAFQVILLFSYPLIRLKVESYGSVGVLVALAVYAALLIVPAWLHKYAVKNISIVKRFGL